MSTERFDKVIQRADRVMRHWTSATAPSAKPRGASGNASTPTSWAASLASGWRSVSSASLTIIVGLITPIGMFGFLAAVGVAIGVVALLGFMPSGKGNATAPAKDLPNGAMVQKFDSYLYRQRAALPAPARAEIDAISRILPSLKQTLERVNDLDPDAQDARRLMSMHLPGLIDRYVNVPQAFAARRTAKGSPWTSGWSKDWRPGEKR